MASCTGYCLAPVAGLSTEVQYACLNVDNFTLLQAEAAGWGEEELNWEDDANW